MDAVLLRPGARRRFGAWDFTAGSLGAGWIIPGAAALSGGLAIIPTLGAELIAFDFEGAYSGGIAPGWYLRGSATPAESADAHGGLSAQSVSDTDSSVNSVSYTFAAVYGTYYRLSFWIKRTAGSGGPKVYTPYIETDIPGFSATAGWAQQFTAGRCINSAPTGRMDLYTTTLGTTILYDDISIRALSTASCAAYRRSPGSAYKITLFPQSAVSFNSIGVWAVVDNPYNPQNGVLAYHNLNNNIVLEKVVGGTWTSLVNSVITYNASYSIEVRRSGNVYQLFYGGVQYGSDQTIADAAIAAAKYCGLFSLYEGNILKSFQLSTN
jgi:hypothetical protein